MNPIDFLKELNEVDEELLMKAELPPERKRPLGKVGVRIMAAALVLCLLSVTVAAVSLSVRIFISGETVPDYKSDYGGLFQTNSKVITIEYELFPQSVTIPLQWQAALSDAWKGFGYDYKHFVGIDLKDNDGRRSNFGGLAELEGLLGLELVSSEELEQITKGVFVTLAVTDQARAAEQFRSEGIVSPDGIIIYLSFLYNAQSGWSPEIVDYCGLSIFVPLTPSFAEQYATHCVLSGVYKQEVTQKSFHSKGGVEVFLLEDAVQGEDALNAYAAWEQSGVGYLVEMKTNWGVPLRPTALLMPYLENLEG